MFTFYGSVFSTKGFFVLVFCSFIYLFIYFVAILFLLYSLIHISSFIHFHLTLLFIFSLFHHICLFCFLCLRLLSWHSVWSCFFCCVLGSFAFNLLISFLVSFLSTGCNLFSLDCFGFVCTCVPLVCFYLSYFPFHLSGVPFASWFFLCFSVFVLVLHWQNKWLVNLDSPPRDWAEPVMGCWVKDTRLPRELLTQEVLNDENFHKGLHVSKIQPHPLLAAHRAGCLLQSTGKTRIPNQIISMQAAGGHHGELRW